MWPVCGGRCWTPSVLFLGCKRMIWGGLGVPCQSDGVGPPAQQVPWQQGGGAPHLVAVLECWRGPEVAGGVRRCAHAAPQSLPTGLHRPRPAGAVGAPLAEDPQPGPLAGRRVQRAACAFKTLPSGAGRRPACSGGGPLHSSHAATYCPAPLAAPSVTAGPRSGGSGGPGARRAACGSSAPPSSRLGMCNVASHVLLADELRQDGGVTQNAPGGRAGFTSSAHSCGSFYG